MKTCYSDFYDNNLEKVIEEIKEAYEPSEDEIEEAMSALYGSEESDREDRLYDETKDDALTEGDL